ncbi:hypothetical protein G5714_002724, partial [Scomber scombrus]
LYVKIFRQRGSKTCPPAEEMELTILDTFLDASVDSLSLYDNDITDPDYVLYDDDIADPDYVPTPTPRMTLTQTEVELGEPVEEVREPGPQPEVEGRKRESLPPMKEPCGAKCRRRCTDHISEERRREVWNQYWEMKYTERRSWMFHSVTPLPTKRMNTGPESHCGRSFIYWLHDHKGGPRQVCKLFFLSTLGYHPKNDSLVISMMG